MTTAETNDRDDATNQLDVPIVHQDASEQQELRRRYLEQQARRACPGCGEDAFVG